jgi:ABC-type lipoprotein export system ATPase subunit
MLKRGNGDTMALLKLKDIGKIYVSEGNVTVGIRGVNLSFDTGEFVAVTGKSGSGKSTLLNVISGMDSYEEGELFIDGQTTSHYLEPDWEDYREQYVSFIFQDYNIIESFTVLENVELALTHIEDKKARRERAVQLLTRVGLGDRLSQKGSKLSGGQKQRTVIARALAKDCPIVLADEPTGNLDSKTAKEIIELLREVSKDKLLIVVTHNFDQVQEFATRHVRIYDGAVESDHVIKRPDQTVREREETGETRGAGGAENGETCRQKPKETPKDTRKETRKEKRKKNA